MTSLVNIFVPARYTCNDKTGVRMFRAQFGGSRLWAIGAAAIVV